MKAILATLALVALVAMAAFVLMSTRRSRGELRSAQTPTGQTASPIAPQSATLTAPVPVVDPLEPALAASTDVAARAGVPVLDAVLDSPTATAVSDAPIVVADSPAVVTQSPTVVADSPAVVAGPLPVAASPTAVAPDPRNQPLESLGPAPAPSLDPRPFAEAHWQGLEAIPKTPTVAKMLKVPSNVEGVILDDVSLPADLQGFQAGDVVTAVDGVPTPDLLSFIRATDRIRDSKRVTVDFVRAGVARQMGITALFERLGTANGETPPMIPPGAQRPHVYMGPCVNCHRIGTTGNLAVDQGDNPKNKPGPVRADGPVPHRDRGPCATCHPIIP
jgi:hypothetical protein